MTRGIKNADSILDTAMQLAEIKSWENLHLHHVATELNITLKQIHEHYQQKDDLVEAWYDRADAHMLKAAAAPGFLEMEIQARLHRLIMVWLETLAEHKTVSRDMLWYKLEPAHIHLQVLGLLRISRTVQWFLEAAHQDATHLRRIIGEIGLTSIYLATFVYWMRDGSENHQRTRDFLQRKLHRASQCARFMPGCSGLWQSVHRVSEPASNSSDS